MIQDIAGVVSRLDGIVAETSAAGDPRGYFAALYRQVTLRVQAGIASGAFRDGPRMERLDIIFAGRYFEAYDAFRAGAGCSRSWQVAFEAGAEDRAILQHLLLGMNAHINLDLGIAAAAVGDEGDRASLEQDFGLLNVLIAELVDGAQIAIARHAPLMDVVDRVGGRGDERIADFNMRLAREEAWEACEALLRRSELRRRLYIERLDRRTALLGRVLRWPHGPLGHAWALVRSGETGSVAEVIAALNGVAGSGPR